MDTHDASPDSIQILPEFGKWREKVEAADLSWLMELRGKAIQNMVDIFNVDKYTATIDVDNDIGESTDPIRSLEGIIALQEVVIASNLQGVLRDYEP